MAYSTYHLRSSSLATATALMLNLPLVGQFDSSEPPPASVYEFESFAEVGKVVAEALASSTIGRATPQEVFTLMTEVATRIIEESRPLDREFAKVVDKEFWNLLQ